MPTGATEDLKCHRPLYGTWVSVNKTDLVENDIRILQFLEVRVFGYTGELI